MPCRTLSGGLIRVQALHSVPFNSARAAALGTPPADTRPGCPPLATPLRGASSRHVTARLASAIATAPASGPPRSSVRPALAESSAAMAFSDRPRPRLLAGAAEAAPAVAGRHAGRVSAGAVPMAVARAELNGTDCRACTHAGLSDRRRRALLVRWRRVAATADVLTLDACRAGREEGPRRDFEVATDFATESRAAGRTERRGPSSLPARQGHSIRPAGRRSRC